LKKSETQPEKGTKHWLPILTKEEYAGYEAGGESTHGSVSGDGTGKRGEGSIGKEKVVEPG